MRIVLLSALVLICNVSLWAKDGFKIKGTITNVTSDSLLYLCNYYGKSGEIYKVDSVRTTIGTTQFTFKRDSAITGGIYLLLFADRSLQFELMLNNGDDIEMSFDKSNPFPSAQFKRSPDNEDFYKYQNYIQGMQIEFSKIQDLQNKMTKADSTEAENISRSIGKKIEDYRKDFIKAKPNSMLATLFRSLAEPIIPESYNKIENKNSKDSARYVYYKTHYWDDFNFKDDRIIYTPIYESKLENYFKNLVAPQADSLIKEIRMVMNNTEGTKDLFRYSFWWLAKYTGTHKVMGVDEAYVWMIENYVMRDKCWWIDDTTRKNYEKDFFRISPGLMGKPASEMELWTRDGKAQKLSTTVFANDYTLIAFYDPTCHHCQKEIPLMDSTIRAVKKAFGVKVKIWGIQNASEDEKWNKMITDNKLTEDIWVHLSDPKGVNMPNYRAVYNIVSNPTFYLLDGDGKIVGKRIDHSNIYGLFEFLEKKKKGKDIK